MLIKSLSCSPLKTKNLFSVSGITLIELMVVIAIIGILATLVFPSFEQQILTARRNEGINQLLMLKVRQEAYRLENVSYGTTKQLTVPSSDFYIFSISDVSSTTYILQAKAIGSQVSDIECKSLTIDQSLNKSPAICFSK